MFYMLCFVDLNRTTLEREQERMELQSEMNGRLLSPIGSQTGRTRAEDGRELVSGASCEEVVSPELGRELS